MRKICVIVFFLAVLKLDAFTNPLPGGTYKVGTKHGDNYASLADAIRAANYGISGPVTFLLTDTSYFVDTVLAIKPSSGTSATKTLTIKPATGVIVKITGSISSAIFKIYGTGYVTIDGNAGKNLIITNTYSVLYSLPVVIWLADSSATFTANHNIIQNCIIYGNSSTTTVAGVFSGGSTTGTLSTGKGTKSNNIIRNNIISKAQNGIYVLGPSTQVLDSGLQITNNTLGSRASGDGFVESGITAKYQTGALISGNDIQNLVYNGSLVLRDYHNNPIAAGLYLFNSKNTSIESNKIHYINFSGLTQRICYGISLENFAFSTSDHASNNYVYNNMVYDARDSALGAAGWLYSGINENGGYNDQLYFNTVYVSGNFASDYPVSVAAFSNGNSANTTATHAAIVKNNIFAIENITDGNLNSNFYCHYSKSTGIDSGNVWNANDLYFNVNLNYGTGITGYYKGLKDTTLTKWRMATGMEAASHNRKPFFLSSKRPVDVHLTGADSDFNFGIPVKNPISIKTDIDGDTRSKTKPYVGADEYKQFDKEERFPYSAIASVNFIKSSLFTIAPNPATNNITVTIPISDAVSEIIMYDVVGNKIMHEIITANTVSKQINISQLVTGVYTVVLLQNGKREIIKLMKNR